MTSPDPIDGHTTPPPPVPDDRIHGDSLHDGSVQGGSVHGGSVRPDATRGADPYGDSWLRPTLNAEPGPTAGTPRPGQAPAEQTLAPGRRRSRRPRRQWWVVAGLGATLVAAGVAGLTPWGSSSGGMGRSVDQQQAYAAPAGALTIRAGTHDVEVRGGGAAGTVAVGRHLSWGLAAQQPTPSDAWTGSVLELGADCHGAVSGCSADYVVTVPDASDVTVATGSGDITLSGSLGDVTLTAGSGDIETQDLVADRVSARADSGDIDVELAGAASPIGISTGSGDVSVRLPRATSYVVDVVSGSGDTDVGVPTDPGSTRTVRVRTGSGDIEVDEG